jgi:hypothetical protein
MSGEQNCRKQKLKESDISPKNSLNFLAYNRLDFLDISCLHFVTIALDFDQIFNVLCEFLDYTPV